jgi:proline iminopeptidase
MPKIKINDTELYYTEHGTGIPFLVMHGGLGVDHSYFRPTFDPLGDIFKLIYYDHRGNGRSGRPPLDTITYEQLATDTHVLREILGYDQIGVIGHSAGGYVALQYAIHHQKNLSYLILIDTAPAFDYMKELLDNVKNKNPTPEMIATLNAPAAPTIEGFQQQFKILQPLYFYDFNSEIKEKTDEIVEKMILNPEVAALNDVLTPKFNVTSQLSEIKVPTLILVGIDDFICPPSQAKRMHNSISNSELVIFERCGHYPFYEVPDEFFRILRDWFKKVHQK